MLTKEERLSLLKLARDTIGARLGKNEPAGFSPGKSVLSEPRGAFVTLHKHGSLRGCIGYVEAIKPLYQTVREMAIAAAFQDPRFESVTGGEFDQLEIEISVMSPVKKISSIDEIEVGKHGLIMKAGFNQGLLLPQVAIEQGWDKETFLSHTCNKAGLYGDCWKKPETEIFIFSAEVFSESNY
jgi:AmmeMemoRadiSam system protein A